MAEHSDRPQITLGVDTHADIHVAAAIDQHGRMLSTLTVPSTVAGHRDLVAWAEALGAIRCAGVEGTGAYGAGLTRHLHRAGITVVEVDRPNRRLRRTRGKSDEIDAEIAARAVLAGELRTCPKTSDGHVEGLRMIRVARRSAVKARTQAANQLHALVITAPDELRTQLRELSLVRLVDAACHLRPSGAHDPMSVAKLTLRSVARRHRALAAEVAALDRETRVIVGLAAPRLLALQNVGPETAAALLIAAGDNPERLRNEGSFAHLCGVAPLSASSGKTRRHRLNRGGNREANAALYTVVLGRMFRDERTKAYVVRRTAEGLSKREIFRCLKRFVAREVYGVLPFGPSSERTSVNASTASPDVDRAA